MRRDRANTLKRQHVREHLSPTAEDRRFVTRVYASVTDALGAAHCLQIGSYPRYTSIRPLHDLDVLYILGAWNAADHNPKSALDRVEAVLCARYVNPTLHQVRIERQTHSIGIRFMDGNEEVFAVDIVPSYTFGRNEFADDMYMVPEVAITPHYQRRRLDEQVARGQRGMDWIKSDPRGYITVAAGLNEHNEDFRRAVKFVKGWKSACKRIDPEFPLKSFHLEQAVTRTFQADIHTDIFGAVFEFFCNLPNLIRYPTIPDRADPDKMIDAYVADLNDRQRRDIMKFRDAFLIGLEQIADTPQAVAGLLSGARHVRADAAEAYLFDQRIPTFTETDFSIVATALERNGSFRRMILDALGLIQADRRIEFRVANDAPPADLYKWKVKNADDSEQPRGEITDHQTRYDPEHTRYKGAHYVECFAIRNGACIGKARQNVVLQWGKAA